MSSMALMPGNFHGLMNEDAESWFRDLEHYCAYKKLDDAGRIGLVPLLLKDGARYWFDALDNGRKDTFDHLSTAFHNEYKRDEAIRWRDSADVWSVTQLPTQSVEDYISKVQQKALRAKMTEDQIRFPLIRGLLPEIRQSVLQHEPTTVADIKKWATIAESSRIDTTSNAVTEAVKRLEEKFDGLQTATLSPNRARSQSPRVRFQESSGRSSSPAPQDFRRNNQSSDYRPAWRAQPSFNRSSRGDNARNNRRSFPSSNDGRRFSQDFSRQGSNNYSASGNNYYQGQQGGRFNVLCYCCGLIRNHNKYNCPARDSRCASCNLFGHYTRLCRRGQMRRPQ